MSRGGPAGTPRASAEPERGPSRPGAWLAVWVTWAGRAAPWVTLVFLAVTVLLLVGPVRNLGIDTDTADMIAEDLPWRQTYIAYKEVFPRHVNQLVVVVEGETPDLAQRARSSLARRLRSEPELFPSLHLPGGGAFFRRHALLYLSRDELSTLAENLERFGPWLSRLERNPDLSGFLATLRAMLADARRGADAPDLAPLLGAVARGVRASLEWRFDQLSWQELLWGRPATRAERRALILVQPRLDYAAFLPAARPMRRIRAIADELGLSGDRGVRVRLTGEVAMEHEELLGAMRGASRAGLLALAMVAVILFLGLRSVSLMAASVATLVAGLVATAGFAALAVGHLNLISVAFAVLFIGLGIDYAIHFCLRYRELRLRSAVGHRAALSGAAGDVGPAVALSALTTAVCFYAFIPTDFVGVSELGVIAGTGMFIGLLCTLTLLPALLSLWRPRIAAPGGSGERSAERRARGGAEERARRPPSESSSGPLDRAVEVARRWRPRLASLPSRRPRLVLGLAAIAALVSALLLPRARFDPNPLALRDPETESVVAYRELLADTAASPLTLVVLEPDASAARSTAERLAGLELVKDALTLQDFVPRGQEEKLERIAAIRRRLGPEPARAAEPAGAEAVAPATESAGASGEPDDPDLAPPAASTDLAEARALLESLAAFRPFAGADARAAARYLGFQVRAWLERAETASPAARAGLRRSLERTLVGSLPGRIDALRASLAADRVRREDLPKDLVERWVSGGLHRVEVRPREVVAETPALRRFVEAVQAAESDATGAALVELEAGGAVVRAFRSAFAYAALGIVVLLLVALRRVRDTAYALLPLLLAAALTVAFSVAAGVPFNFANVIALPLLLGVGVDHGIHMIHRARSAPPSHGDLLRTSTARAVVYSSLTTVAGFGNLAFSGHPGTASMGALLTAGMAAVLVCTLALLPALLAPPRVDKARGRA